MADTANKKQDIIADLNRETSKIPWSELQKFFAQGLCVHIDESLDLLDAVAEITLDNKAFLEDLMQQELAGPVADDIATHWLADDQQVWAVVVAPYIFVQKVKARSKEH